MASPLAGTSGGVVHKVSAVVDSDSIRNDHARPMAARRCLSTERADVVVCRHGLLVLSSFFFDPRGASGTSAGSYSHMTRGKPFPMMKMHNHCAIF